MGVDSQVIELMGDYLLRIYNRSNGDFTIKFTKNSDGEIRGYATVDGVYYEGIPSYNFYEAMQGLNLRVSNGRSGKYIDPLKKDDSLKKRLGIL